MEKDQGAFGRFPIRKPTFEPGFYFQRQVLGALNRDDDQIGLARDLGGFGGDSRIVEIFETAPGDFKSQVFVENFLECLTEANGCVARRIVLVKDDYGANPGFRPRLRIST